MHSPRLAPLRRDGRSPLIVKRSYCHWFNYPSLRDMSTCVPKLPLIKFYGHSICFHKAETTSAVVLHLTRAFWPARLLSNAIPLYIHCSFKFIEQSSLLIVSLIRRSVPTSLTKTTSLKNLKKNYELAFTKQA
uniref:Uncharacterized protein n=1 Tax=Steinernema glaseri TaxID=37863 RepID=A0A1I7ZW34_9BILA